VIARAAALGGIGLLFGCTRCPSPLSPNLGGPAVGLPTRGVLLSAAELPSSGAGFEWLKTQGHHWGVPRLVQAIEEAAGQVARERPGGAPLVVGDLSDERGGLLTGHRSHHTGRDADLLFYVETLAGEPTASPGFVRFGPDGLAKVGKGKASSYVRFDVAREWVLIKSLALSEQANVQWLFVSRPLEALITEYARAMGEPDDLVWHAETVMRQPSDSAPHDDHLHLRTACLPEEALAGCEGGGPYWPWLPELPALSAAAEEELYGELSAPAPDRPQSMEARGEP
jgi:penicillin-insensitive murein endopeptidase